MACHPQAVPIRCVVRNLSQAGARLEFSASASLPDVVDLTITQRSETRRASVVWRSGGSAGVAFHAPERVQAAPISLDLMRRLRDSEAEVRRLRQRLVALGDAL